MNALLPVRKPRVPLLAIACLAICALGATASSPLIAQEGQEETIRRSGDLVSIFGGRIVVPSNVRQRGSVISIGGDVIIEGEVTQDVVVVLGSLKLTGRVGGTVSAIMSDQELRDAYVEDEYVSVLGSVDMERSRIGREFFHILGPLEQDGFSTRPMFNMGHWLPSFWTFVTWARVLRLLTVFVLLLLLAALIPERIRLIADEAPVRYLPAFFIGLLAYLGLWVLLVAVSVTVIGLPVAIIGYYVLKWLGIAGIFYAVGRRLGRGFGREMSLLGALLLTFGIYALITLATAPLGIVGLLVAILLRTIFFIVVEAPAIGLVLMTRLGTRRHDEQRPPIVPPVIPSSDPEPPGFTPGGPAGAGSPTGAAPES
jgi:hypothetical protein